MRFVVVGAGAVGGLVGGRLAQHGHDVLLVARGAHREAIDRDGLRIASPDGDVTVQVPTVGDASDVDHRDGDVVLLAVKSQHTEAALAALAGAPASTPIVCLQNGVANERAVLRRFESVHAVCVMCPAAHDEPGVVVTFATPVNAILDIGRYPSGADDTTMAVAAAFRRAGFVSEARPDVMRWKYAKLLLNLTNAVEALCGLDARQGELGQLVRAEGEVVLRAAGIDFASAEEDTARRGDIFRVRPAGDRPRAGSSTWQSLERGTGNVESDWLNGEIALLARLHGVPAPANALVQRLANRLAATGRPPGTTPEAEVLAQLQDVPG